MMASKQGTNNNKSDEGGEEGGIPLHLLKNLRKGGASEAAESGSSNGEANNSDNSALVSIGNTSFGFNFDSEDQSSPNNSEGDRNENSEDSGDDQQKRQQRKPSSSSNQAASVVKQVEPFRPGPVASQTSGGSSNGGGSGSMKTSVSSLTNTSTSQEAQQEQQQQQQGSGSFAPRTTPTSTTANNVSSHNEAAAFAVANLRNIANGTNGDYQTLASMVTSSEAVQQQQQDMYNNNNSDEKMAAPATSSSSGGRKRKADDNDGSAGYHTDDEGRSISMNSMQGDNDLDSRGSGGRGGGGKKGKKHGNETKREERNQREKERSLRISKQINDLRSLLSNGGVIVPKGTKSSVLTEAANYIRMLQQHQYRSELDRHQLIQQMQLIGNGAHGAQAARAIRHVAAQNGVWSLGNFGGVPPKSAMSFYQPTAGGAGDAGPEAPEVTNPNKIETSDYKFIFNSCGVGMAVASLGGAFIDCNHLFCQLSNYSKQEVCGLTIFNLTARQDLQHAFDLISQMISPPVESRNHEPKPILLRGSMKNRGDLGLSISLVKGEDGIAKCFCATLIKNPESPFDTAKPVPVSFDAIQNRSGQPNFTANNKQESNLSTPAFTLG